MIQGIGLGIGINRSNYAQGIFNAYQSRVIADGGVTEAGACVDAVSGLLLTASLLLIPSGYKSGKAYAQIPTNGNGDLTWTRASTALRTNSTGLLQSMGSGVPRLSYMYGSCPALLLEPQRTNSVFPSEDFSTTWSAVDTTVTTNQTTAPDGNTTADRISITSNGGYIRRFSLTVLNSTTYTISAFVKNDTITSGNTFRFYFNNNLGSINAAEAKAVIDINAGTATAQSGGSGVSNVSASITSLTNSWFRVQVTFTLGATAGSANAEIGFEAPTATRTFFAWGAQLEAGAYPTTYIPTTTASATRVADSFSRNNIFTNGLITSSGGTWFVELRNNIAYTRDSSGSELYIGEDASSGVANGQKAILIRNNGGGAVVLTLAFWNGSTLAPLYVASTSTIKLAIKFDGTTADIFANGTKVVTSASVALTLANMQHLNALSGVPRFIQAMALYPSPLSDTDCTTLTTL
jgi:hypothetical protein